MKRDSHHPHTEYQSSGDDYWSRARRPFAGLVFLAPILLLYEMGVYSLGGSHPELLRNGADHWMHVWLQQVGLDHPGVLPGAIVLGLLAWQVGGRFSWRVGPETLVGMSAESLLFAFCLVVLGQVQDLVFQHSHALSPLRTGSQAGAHVWGQVVGFLGAGVYEEFLFRLCLLPVGFLLFRMLLMPRKWAWAASILATSIIFAVAHYVGPAADQFSAFSFSFRMLAGLCFALLFVLRGFGIAVGCHAAYDLLVGVFLQMRN